IHILGGEEIVYADQDRIQQVIQNLVQNAIRYGHTPDEKPRITISAMMRGEEMVISVADQGPGIDEEYRERIFGIFQRLSNDKEGTGVGLAIVRKVAAAHNGRAWVESGANGGSVFSISFPMKKAAIAA
ncbi:MAG: ATP-binding protein, partial [Phycisphaerales bacterium]|nr:ATP-binding protein [Phycisphaerales bacterium]